MIIELSRIKYVPLGNAEHSGASLSETLSDVPGQHSTQRRAKCIANEWCEICPGPGHIGDVQYWWCTCTCTRDVGLRTQDALTKVQSHRHLGVIFSHDLRWNNRVDFILTKATRLLSVLRRLRSSLDQESLSHMYLTYIRPILKYAWSTPWGNQGTTVDRLERFRRRAAKIILRRPLFLPSNHDELLATIGCLARLIWLQRKSSRVETERGWVICPLHRCSEDGSSHRYPAFFCGCWVSSPYCDS